MIGVIFYSILLTIGIGISYVILISILSTWQMNPLRIIMLTISLISVFICSIVMFSSIRIKGHVKDTERHSVEALSLVMPNNEISVETVADQLIKEYSFLRKYIDTDKVRFILNENNIDLNKIPNSVSKIQAIVDGFMINIYKIINRIIFRMIIFLMILIIIPTTIIVYSQQKQDKMLKNSRMRLMEFE